MQSQEWQEARLAEHGIVPPHEDPNWQVENETMLREHGDHVYQELIATPFIPWGSAIPAGRVVEDPIENIDLPPTLLELCDITPHGGLDGRSLVPLLRNEATNAPRFVHSYELHQVSIREVATDLKLIQPTPCGRLKDAQLQLYELSSDPHERTNLASEHPADLKRLQTELEAWIKAHPTESSLTQEWSEEDLETLRALGYPEGQLGPAGDRD